MPGQRWLMRNATRRPVEIHRRDSVLVLLSGETLEIEEADPECLALERQGVLTRHACPGPPPADTARSGGGQARAEAMAAGQLPAKAGAAAPGATTGDTGETTATNEPPASNDAATAPTEAESVRPKRRGKGEPA